MSEARKRGRRILAGVLLLALALGGLWAAARIPPGNELAARLLSAWLGKPVAIDSIRLTIESGVDVELEGVRVGSGPGAPADAPPVFEVARALGRQSWPRLLAGQLVPLSWELQQPVLRLSADAAGGGGPPSIPELDLAVRGGRIEWQRAGAPPLVARDLEVQARRGSLASEARGRAAGALYSGDTRLCSLDVDFEGWLDEGTVRGSVERLDLAQLPLPSLPMRGRATGRFTLQRSARDTLLDLELAIASFELAPARLHHPLRPQETQIDAGVTWRAGAVDVGLRRVRLDDVDVSGTVSVERKPGGRSRGELAFAPFRPGTSPRLHPMHVLAALMESWEKRNEHIAGGRIYDASLRWDLPLSELAAAASFDRPSTDEELEIRLKAENGVYTLSESSAPLEDISGELEIRGNTLHVSQLKLRHGTDRLPELDVRIDGMTRLAHLPDAERSVPDGPGVPLPGIGPLFRKLSEGDRPADRPLLLRLRNVDLYWPPALLPVRDARGEFAQRGHTLEAKLERAVVGGVPAALDVAWNREANRLAVDLRYREGDVPPRTPAPHWLAGSVELAALEIGGWRFADVGGRVTVIGDRVELGGVQGRLAGGPVTARGEISLGEPAAAPYWLEFEGSGADASQLAERIDLKPEDVAGTLSGKGRLEGRLAPGESFLDSARLVADLELNEGHIGGLPALVAIARLPSLRGAPGALLGRPLAVRTAVGRVSIADGTLTLADARVDGPDLRLIADGEIQLRDPERSRDVLITIFFLRAVDDLIAQVPFIGRFVLGKDESLVGASFRVEGPRDRTRVTPVPPEMITNATQWATGVVSRGVRRLRALIRLEKPNDGDTAADIRAQPDPGPP
jgi:hypothetical protein